MATREQRERFLERAKVRWVEQYGVIPLCACGCGETVGFNSRGVPNRFVAASHSTRKGDVVHSVVMQQVHEVRRQKDGSIPIDKFWVACEKIKADKGWSWRELSVAGGLHPRHLIGMRSDNRLKSVSRDWGVDFFRRVAGMSASPSVYQRTVLLKRAKVVDREVPW